jgi:hypothetical protein
MRIIQTVYDALIAFITQALKDRSCAISLKEIISNGWKKKMSINTICECGHGKIIHTGWSDGWDSEWETGCNFGDGDCQCKFFRADNLRYLEMLSNVK